MWPQDTHIDPWATFRVQPPLTLIATKPHKCCQRSPTLPTVHGMLDRHSTGSTRTQIAEPPRAVVDVPLSPQLAEAAKRVTRGQLSMCLWVHI